MDELKYITCLCQNCSGSIQFPDHAVGQEVSCPQCGLSTILYVPQCRQVRGADKHRAVLAVVVSGVVIFGAVAFYLGAQWASKSARSEADKPTANEPTEAQRTRSSTLVPERKPIVERDMARGVSSAPQTDSRGPQIFRMDAELMKRDGITPRTPEAPPARELGPADSQHYERTDTICFYDPSEKYELRIHRIVPGRQIVDEMLIFYTQY